MTKCYQLPVSELLVLCAHHSLVKYRMLRLSQPRYNVSLTTCSWARLITKYIRMLHKGRFYHYSQTFIINQVSEFRQISLLFMLAFPRHNVWSHLNFFLVQRVSKKQCTKTDFLPRHTVMADSSWNSGIAESLTNGQKITPTTSTTEVHVRKSLRNKNTLSGLVIRTTWFNERRIEF